MKNKILIILLLFLGISLTGCYKYTPVIEKRKANKKAPNLELMFTKIGTFSYVIFYISLIILFY